MEIRCTRPSCIRPQNFFGDLDDRAKLRTAQQRYCTNCGMPLFLADRYIPSKLLGQGGFGAAFLACDRYKPKMSSCVVKQFQPAGDLDADELALAQNLFQREAVVLEDLGHLHPQIPDLYAFFTPIVSNAKGMGEEQYFYLAQEFIDGQDLDEELVAKGRLTEVEVTEILIEILKVLQFVHDRNIIHRDIKPSNIMRDKQGILHLLDFGAVKQVAVGGGNAKKSTGIYSAGFAPPEQITGSQVYPCTDIYALAVTCIILLTGKSVEELYDSHSISWNWQSYAPKIKDSLVTTLQKMLLSTPADRYQSASEVLSALTAPTKTNQPPRSTPFVKNSSNNTPANSPVVSTVSTQPNQPSTPVPAKPIPSTPSVSSSGSIQKSKASFSLMEILGSAAFTGFEGALLYIGLTSLLSVSGVSLGILGAVMGGMVFALNRRAIEKIDLIILAGITAIIIAWLPALHGALLLPSIFIVAGISAAGAIAVTAFFRLVYQLLSRFL